MKKKRRKKKTSCWWDMTIIVRRKQKSYMNYYLEWAVKVKSIANIVQDFKKTTV